MNELDNKTIEKLQYDLVRDNLLDFEDLERAREIAKVQNTNLGAALINSSLISEEKLMKFFEEKGHKQRKLDKMRWQRNMFHMKGQDKTLEDHLSKVEIGNLSEKEFRIMIPKMIPKTLE